MLPSILVLLSLPSFRVVPHIVSSYVDIYPSLSSLPLDLYHVGLGYTDSVSSALWHDFPGRTPVTAGY